MALVAMGRAGLVWKVRLPADLPYRPELASVNPPRVPTAPRLTTQLRMVLLPALNESVFGLQALCVAIARGRGLPTRLLAAFVLPWAMLVERTRVRCCLTTA